jgi:hypothetical protein
MDIINFYTAKILHNSTFSSSSERCFYCDRITLNQGFYLFGLDNTSPSFASATENAVPAVTFILATLIRQEHIAYRPS